MTSMRERAVPFRAGHVKGERAAPQPHLMSAHASGAKVLLADLSEFQADINDAAYLRWSKAVIIRAMYGDAHVDHAWRGGGRRDALHAGGAQFTGLYQYIVAGQDAATQARALARLLGKLRAGEKVIGDFEEGGGPQQGRRNAWADVIAAELGDRPWSYSGESFAQDHGLAPVDWVAAYRSSEPSVPHKVWQFTDRFNVPGVGFADCSVFHGTITELAALAHGGNVPAPIPAWQETLMNALPTLGPDDRDHAGSVAFVRRVQALTVVVGTVNKLPDAAAVKATGVFDQATRKGVLAVQKFFGLAQDGIVGPASWGALIAGQHP